MDSSEAMLMATMSPLGRIYQNFDESAYNVKPPTQMLRFIDGLRYHKPTSKESAALNLSSATERISLHVLNDVRTVRMHTGRH